MHEGLAERVEGGRKRGVESSLNVMANGDA